MFGFKYLGNTHVPHRKNTAQMPAVKMPPPDEVLLHVAQNIGAPAKVIVKAGDEVKSGDTLCVIELGKIKNSIPAPMTGIIASVAIKVSDKVESGDLLITMTE